MWSLETSHIGGWVVVSSQSTSHTGRWCSPRAQLSLKGFSPLSLVAHIIIILFLLVVSRYSYDSLLCAFYWDPRRLCITFSRDLWEKGGPLVEPVLGPSVNIAIKSRSPRWPSYTYQSSRHTRCVMGKLVCHRFLAPDFILLLGPCWLDQGVEQESGYNTWISFHPAKTKVYFFWIRTHKVQW